MYLRIHMWALGGPDQVDRPLRDTLTLLSFKPQVLILALLTLVS